MALIHILDKQSDEIISTLNSAKLEYKDLKVVDSISNMNTFDFTALTKFDILEKRNRILVPDLDGNYSEFVISLADQYKRGEKKVEADASYVDLATAKIIDPQTLVGSTPSVSVNVALSGTEWIPGNIEHSDSIRSIKIDDYMDPYSLLKLIATTFEMELRFRVEIDGNKITGRYVDLVKSIAGFEGKEIVFGKDLLGLRRIENGRDIVSALYAVGPDNEDGTPLTALVENEEARQRWSRNGNHLIRVYRPESEDSDMTMSELKTLATTELDKYVNAIVSYECEAVSLEHVIGREHEKIRKGQTVRIKDDGYTPPLYLEARIREVTYDPLTKKVISFKIGNYIEHKKEDLAKQFESLKNSVRDRIDSMLYVTVTSSSGDVFKNGEGSTTLTANVLLSGAEVDASGTKYSYIWKKFNNNGEGVPFNKTGKSINVNAIDVDIKSTYVVEVTSDKINIPAEYTIVELFDGTDGENGLDGLDGYTPVKGIDYFDGKHGQDGKSNYVWVMYSNNPNGIPMTEEPQDAKYIGIAVTETSTRPSDRNDYKWSLIQGDDGLPGEKGTDGRTSYLHIKYSNDEGVTFTSDNGETVGDWIGTYVDFLPNDSNNPNDYVWNKVKGEKGDRGPQGPTGIGIGSIVEHYLASPLSSGITVESSGWTTTMQPLTNSNKYLWNYEKVVFTDGTSENTTPVIIGVHGNDGVSGEDGRSIVAITEHYLTSSSDSGITRTTPGWSVKMEATTPNMKYLWNYETITWSSHPVLTYVEPVIIGVHGDTGPQGPKGDNGPPGIQGPPGTNGVSQYVHIRYSDASDGNPFYTTPKASTKYIGIASNSSQTAPTPHQSYTWSLFKGQDGQDGSQGIPGAPGTNRYIWIKYALSNEGDGLSDNPSGMKYIGIAYNKTTPDESNDPNLYEWSLLPQSIEVGNRNLLISSLLEYNGDMDDASTRSLSGSGVGYISHEVDLTPGDSYVLSNTSISNSSTLYPNAVRVRLYDSTGSTPKSLDFVLFSGGYKSFIAPSNTVKGDKLMLFVSDNTKSVDFEIRELQLEKSDIRTGWDYSPEDIQAQMDDKAGIRDLDDMAEHLSDLAAQIDTYTKYTEFEEMRDSYEARVNQDILDKEELANSILDINQRTVGIVNELGETSRVTRFVDTVIKEADEGILVSRESSKTGILITDNRISFMSNDVEVAYISNNTMQITHGIFVETATISDFKFEKIKGTSILAITWVGD